MEISTIFVYSYVILDLFEINRCELKINERNAENAILNLEDIAGRGWETEYFEECKVKQGAQLSSFFQ